MRLTVRYDGSNFELGEKIKELLEESLGAVWYGQGYNFETDERDIAFDLPDEEEE